MRGAPGSVFVKEFPLVGYMTYCENDKKKSQLAMNGTDDGMCG